MIKASKFSLEAGHPLVDEMNAIKYPENHPKKRISFTSGDPKA